MRASRMMFLLRLAGFVVFMIGCATAPVNSQPVSNQQDQPAYDPQREIDYKNMNLLYSDCVKDCYIHEDKVVFCANIGNRPFKDIIFDLFVSKIDGIEQKRISYERSSRGMRPYGWCLDGTKIVYAVPPPTDPDHPELDKDRFHITFQSKYYIVNPDGSDNQRTSRAFFFAVFDWSIYKTKEELKIKK